MRWLPWLSSKADLLSSSLIEDIDRPGVEDSVTETTLMGTLGLAGRAASISGRENGYSAGPPVTFYMEKRSISYIRPLVSFSTGLSLGLLSIEGHGLLAPLPTTDTTKGRIATGASFEYGIHSGVTQTNRSGSAQTIVLRSEDYATSVSLELRFLRFGAGSPRIGGTWIATRQAAVNRDDLSFTSSRFRFDLRLSY